MNKNNTKKLYKQYSFLNSKNMPEDFACSDGWYKLVYAMCKELKALPLSDDFYITKIEEHYGELKVHTRNGDMRTRIVIDEYQAQAYETCVECGQDRELESCDKCKIVEVEYPDEEEEDTDATTATACACGGNCGGNCSGSGGCSGGCSGGNCGTP